MHGRKKYKHIAMIRHLNKLNMNIKSIIIKSLNRFYRKGLQSNRYPQHRQKINSFVFKYPTNPKQLRHRYSYMITNS